MSDRRGAPRGRAEHRAYEDYDDSYATPRSRGNRHQPPLSERGYRPGKYEVPSQPQLQYQTYVNDYPGLPGHTYGVQQGWMPRTSTRAPYATGYQRPQYPEPYPVAPDYQRGAITDRGGSRWGASNGGRPPSARPPNSSGGGSAISTGRALNSVAGGGPMGGGPSGMGRQGGNPSRPPGSARGLSNGGGPGPAASGAARQPSRGRTSGGPSSAGSSGGGADRSRSASRTGGGTGRARAPYVTSVDPAGSALVPAGQSGVEAVPEPPAEPEVPSNPHFLTPAFPQAPRTRTDSCNTWALMVEASSQTLEAVVGPFLEGVLMELFGSSWEQELSGLDLSLPPFNAATCAELVGRCKQLHERLPITIHKRVEAVAKATSALASSPASLEPEDVLAAHTAMKGMLQDCIKAMKMPSLLGEGSRQFRAFVADLLPHAESTIIYYDMLLADCAETSAARQQARTAAAASGDGFFAAGGLLMAAAGEAVSP